MLLCLSTFMSAKSSANCIPTIQRVPQRAVLAAAAADKSEVVFFQRSLPESWGSKIK